MTYVIIGCVIYWALKCCCSRPRTMHGSSSHSAGILLAAVMELGHQVVEPDLDLGFGQVNVIECG